MGHKSFEIEQEREQVYGNIVIIYVAFLAPQLIKNLLAMRETWVQSLGSEDPLEEGMEPASVFLPGESLWTEEPGGLQFMGSQRVGHHWATKHSTAWANMQILMLKKTKEERQIYRPMSCMLSLLCSESSRETGWGKSSKS